MLARYRHCPSECARAVSRLALTALALHLAVASPLLAADDLPIDIPPDEWRELAMGRTLVYMIGDEVFAYERYPMSGNRVELQLSTGECLSGTWTHSEDTYCFDWGDDTPACFRHVRMGEQIVIIQQEAGEDTDAIQQMVGATDLPLLCGQQMS